MHMHTTAQARGCGVCMSCGAAKNMPPGHGASPESSSLLSCTYQYVCRHDHNNHVLWIAWCRKTDKFCLQWVLWLAIAHQSHVFPWNAAVLPWRGTTPASHRDVKRKRHAGRKRNDERCKCRRAVLIISSSSLVRRDGSDGGSHCGP